MSRLAVPGFALLAVACVVTKEPDQDPVLPGTIEVSWQVGPSGCEEAGVATIEVSAAGSTSSFACGDGVGTLSVTPGTFDVALLGVDEGGAPRYEGVAYSVVVRSEQVTQVPTVVLSALPAEVHVTWFFDNGRLCSDELNNGVSTIEAILYDTEDFVEGTVTAECEAGELMIEDVRPGQYTLSLLGRDEASGITHQGEIDLVVDKGDRIEADVQLVTQ